MRNITGRYTHTCIDACIYKYICTHTHTRTYIYICIYRAQEKCDRQIHTSMHQHTHTCMHAQYLAYLRAKSRPLPKIWWSIWWSIDARSYDWSCFSSKKGGSRQNTIEHVIEHWCSTICSSIFFLETGPNKDRGKKNPLPRFHFLNHTSASYWVATISWLLKIIGLFCKTAL